MTFDVSKHFSDRANNMTASEIRELLKVTQRPGMISFAGGLPNPESFPIEIVGAIVEKVLRENGAEALQYGSTEGLPQLRQLLWEKHAREDNANEGDAVMFSNGVQQGLDLLSKVTINQGDTLVLEAPSYLTGGMAFRVYGCEIFAVDLDGGGIRIDLLEETLAGLRHLGRLPKFMYLTPTFHNPAGVTMDLKRRRQVMDLAYEFDLLVVEDDPYHMLNYDDIEVRNLKSLDEDNRVVYFSSFSKILSPGLRLGYAVGQKELIDKMVLAKQTADLCTNTLSQFIAYEYLAGGHLDAHIDKILTLYRRKRNIMVKALGDNMPEGVRWTHPAGGMFLWATFPEGIDTRAMFPKAAERHVAYVHGRSFYFDGRGANQARLNFSHASDENIKIGVERLSAVTLEELERVRAEKKLVA
ncbi:MAG TPA: PLP-dependent aminotransferase family protein [Candidatus Thermoplasmatota archaeon]|nr:PLP-dependent aminotransferase family protein [Candidatus Thermoplasmatota archaeon]